MFNQSSKANDSHESNFHSCSPEDAEFLKSGFDIELLLQYLVDITYKGKGNWSATCPSCKSEYQTLLIQQEPLIVQGVQKGFSSYGSVQCTKNCSTGAVIATLRCDSSSKFINGDLFELSPEEYECVMKGESAVVLLRQEFELLARVMYSRDIDWHDERLLDRIYFVGSGLLWMINDGRYIAMSSKSSTDLNNANSNSESM